MSRPETLMPMSAYSQQDDLAEDLHSGLQRARELLQEGLGARAPSFTPWIVQEQPVRKYRPRQSRAWAHRPRQFVACVFCALLHWSEELHECF